LLQVCRTQPPEVNNFIHENLISSSLTGGFRFWGIFYIDGFSRETAKESFKAIAKIGGVDGNERAAKTWLSSLGPDQPWLLIIDNVDDPDLEVDEFFPEGETGFILITTRVHENIKHGTVGRKSFTFAELESDAAINLLLTCAREKKPWTEKTKAVADTIAKALGYLPLALVHAAAAISKGLCKLAEYLACFQDALAKLREKTRTNKSTAKPKAQDVYLSVYSSYEVIYSNLEKDDAEGSRDAVELLKIFSFFNRENIRVDTLVAAAEIPRLEADADKKAKLEKKKSKTKDSWTVFFRELLFGLRTEVLKDRSLPTLPTMLRDFFQGPSDRSVAIRRYKDRLRLALHLLEQWSLATHDEEHDSYSMHPLIHDWVRLRPQMKLGEQAAWSQAASNTLGQSILLPIGGTPSSKEMEMQRSLLLHLMHLRERKREILAGFNDNVQARLAPMNFLPVVKPTPDTVVKDRFQARQAAKFSYIYFICGHFEEAQELQEVVRDYLVPNLGLEHELSMRVSLFLAKTYWLGGGRFNDAAMLTEQVLKAAKRELGDQHGTTLGVMDELGTIRNYQGRFREAEELLQEAVKGRTMVYGSEHQDTLSSIDNLGQVYWSMFDWERARQLHLKAIEGMEKHAQMGSDHEKTLYAKENLAMTIRELGAAYYEEAHALLEEVVEKRTKLMGKESPWTLMAKSNLAYVKHSMGNHTEAETILRTGLVVADRNLGRDHHGVLATRRRLAEILTAQKKYDEAEKIYIELLDLKLYEGGLREDGAIKGDQKDRIFSLYQFVTFWETQNKVDVALKYCEHLCEILKDSVHPIADLSKKKRSILQAMATEAKSQQGMPTMPTTMNL
jgi:tetratricopeptide (TPR) repeat protein